MTRRACLILALTSTALAGCECGPPPTMPDGGMEDGGMQDDGAMPDGRVPMPDGGGPTELFPPPRITTCPGDSLPRPRAAAARSRAGARRCSSRATCSRPARSSEAARCWSAPTE
ncbi:MAG: hypothetical protein M5U28_27205 [Sandaracinaceae bacterium]|nr:hypothetical protein [Sandaracinaceae bacterium]